MVKGKDLRKKCSFSNEDILQIKALGLTLADVNKQLATYRRGATFLKLVRPCIPGDGIRSFSAVERNRLIKRYDTEATKHSILKFVPASGAASRMFAAWFTAAQQGSFGNTGLDRSFFADLRKMPFYPTLEKDDAVRLMLKKRMSKLYWIISFFQPAFNSAGCRRRLFLFMRIGTVKSGRRWKNILWKPQALIPAPEESVACTLPFQQSMPKPSKPC